MTATGSEPLPGLTSLQNGLDDAGYLVDDGLAMALFLTQSLGQPLLLEGEPGVGKTAAAKALASALDTTFIRLQCYDGISASEALYEWNYQRQLLAIRLAGNGQAEELTGSQISESDLFTGDFLLDRPILKALRHKGPAPAVLLIDEIDRADDEFEALLFEFLGEGAITIPEFGTVSATIKPIVILTSNRSRELHDALKRRCYYHWIDFPTQKRAAEIVRRNAPGANENLVTAATAFVTSARQLDLDKPPGIAEAVDWVSALSVLGLNNLDRGVVEGTLGSIAKTPDDLNTLRMSIEAGELAIAGVNPAGS